MAAHRTERSEVRGQKAKDGISNLDLRIADCGVRNNRAASCRLDSSEWAESPGVLAGLLRALLKQTKRAAKGGSIEYC